MPEDRQALAIIVPPPFLATRKNDGDFYIRNFAHILSDMKFLVEKLRTENNVFSIAREQKESE